MVKCNNESSLTMAKLQILAFLLIVAACALTIDASTKRGNNSKNTWVIFLTWKCYSSHSFIKDHNNQPYKLVCYVGTWANYRKHYPFKIEDVNTEYCTHVMYGFAMLDEFNYTIRAFDPWLDINLSKKKQNNSWIVNCQVIST